MDTSRRKRRKLMGDINMIPMIDVMLVLLIVFMVTAPLITQGIKVELPKADAETVADNDETTLVVSIDAAGQYFISLGETEAENPEPVPLQRIGEDVAKIMDANPAVPVFLEADATIDYGTVMSLLSTLTEASSSEVRLITQPPGGN